MQSLSLVPITEQNEKKNLIKISSLFKNIWVLILF